MPFKLIAVTPTVEATPDYADGDVIGGKMSFANAVRAIGSAGIIRSAHVHSAVDIAANTPIRLMLFDGDPSASTLTENGAPTIHANDLARLIGIVDLSQRLDLGTPVVLFAATPYVPILLASGTTLYVVAIAGGAINLGGTSDLRFHLGIEQLP